MEMKTFINSCKQQVIENTNYSGVDAINTDNVFVVWSCKTLQNCKALLANNLPDDNCYFEFTYNGDKNETYMDKYEKVVNKVIK